MIDTCLQHTPRHSYRPATAKEKEKEKRKRVTVTIKVPVISPDTPTRPGFLVYYIYRETDA